MLDVSRTRPALPHWELVALIASLMAMDAAAIDIFIPALQDIGSSLGIADANTRQLVITAYVIGFGLAQIVYGPLSDRFGRRAPLLIGVAIYVTASFSAIFAPTFATLLVLRALQGIGAAATRVIAVSVVRDCFGGPCMASVMSLIMMVFMIIPVLAPNAGQLVMLFGTWHKIFVLVALFGLAVGLWAAIRLPETLHPEDKRPLTIRKTAEAFKMVLTNRTSLFYCLAATLIFGVLFGFINQVEQLYTEIFNLGSSFTVYFSLVAIFMAASSFTNSRFVERHGMRRLSHTALVSFITMSLLHLLVALAFGGVTPFGLFFPMMIVAFCMFGFIGTNFNALAMDPVGHIAGTASSVFGFIQTLGGGILGALIGSFYNGTLLPLFCGFLILSLGSLGCVPIAERGKLFQRTSQSSGSRSHRVQGDRAPKVPSE